MNEWMLLCRGNCTCHSYSLWHSLPLPDIHGRVCKINFPGLLGTRTATGQAVPKLGWAEPGKIMFQTVRFFHFPSEQSFEKEGEFLEPWKIFNETIFPRLGDEILFSFCFTRIQLSLYNFTRAGCSGRPALSGWVNKLQGRNWERYLSSS